MSRTLGGSHYPTDWTPNRYDDWKLDNGLEDDDAEPEAAEDRAERIREAREDR